jgi:hypothetical protein
MPNPFDPSNLVQINAARVSFDSAKPPYRYACYLTEVFSDYKALLIESNERSGLPSAFICNTHKPWCRQ